MNRSEDKLEEEAHAAADLRDDVDDFALFQRQLVFILRLVRKEHFAQLPS